MKIIKYIQGHVVELELIKIKEYDRYTLYGVYRGVKLLYTTCLDRLQMKHLQKTGFIINEEVENVCN